MLLDCHTATMKIKQLTDFYAHTPESLALLEAKEAKEKRKKEKKKLRSMGKKAESDGEKTESDDEETKKKKQVLEDKKNKALKRKRVVQENKIEWDESKSVSGPGAGQFNVPNTEGMESCIDEMRVFCRGDVPGLSRLKRVLSRMFEHYGVVTSRQQKSVLAQVELRSYYDTGIGRVSFQFDTGGI